MLVVHRPRYPDWTLPKGHRERGETVEETAIREVLEETGLRCRIVAPLATTRHRVDGGDVKEVAWFAMTPLPGSPGFAKNGEVDSIEWLAPKDARKRVSYQNDRELIAEADLGSLSTTGTIRMVRHAVAGERSKWKKKDHERPLTKKGYREARAIADLLADASIDRVVSSPYVRCAQTLEPLASTLGLELELDPRLGEGPGNRPGIEVLAELVGHNAVVCSHGGVIQAALRDLKEAGMTVRGPMYASKASIWEIQVEAGRFTSARYLPPPRV